MIIAGFYALTNGTVGIGRTTYFGSGGTVNPNLLINNVSMGYQPNTTYNVVAGDYISLSLDTMVGMINSNLYSNDTTIDNSRVGIIRGTADLQLSYVIGSDVFSSGTCQYWFGNISGTNHFTNTEFRCNVVSVADNVISIGLLKDFDYNCCFGNNERLKYIGSGNFIFTETPTTYRNSNFRAMFMGCSNLRTLPRGAFNNIYATPQSNANSGTTIPFDIFNGREANPRPIDVYGGLMKGTPENGVAITNIVNGVRYYFSNAPTVIANAGEVIYYATNPDIGVRRTNIIGSNILSKIR